MLRIFVYIILFSFSVSLFGEIDSNSIDTAEYNSQNLDTNEADTIQQLNYISKDVDIILVPHKKLDSLISSGDYIYLTEEEREELGIWDWVKMKLFQWFSNALYRMNELGLIELLAYILGLVCLGFIIYNLINHGFSFGLVNTTNQKSELDLVISNDKEDFDKRIEQAKKNGDSREVVRLSFLKIISELNNKDIIKYSEDKTNRDYFYEIKDDDIKSQFKKVSNIFDYTFYGEFEITDSHLTQVEPLFYNLLNSLDGGNNK